MRTAKQGVVLGSILLAVWLLVSAGQPAVQAQDDKLKIYDSGYSITNARWSDDGFRFVFQEAPEVGVKTESVTWREYDLRTKRLTEYYTWPLQPVLTPAQHEAFQIGTDSGSPSFIFPSPNHRYIIYAARRPAGSEEPVWPVGLADLRTGEHVVFDNVAVASTPALFSDNFEVEWSADSTLATVRTRTLFGSAPRLNLIQNFHTSVLAATATNTTDEGLVVGNETLNPIQNHAFSYPSGGNRALLELPSNTGSDLFLWNIDQPAQSRVITSASLVDARFSADDPDIIWYVDETGFYEHHLPTGQTDLITDTFEASYAEPAWISPNGRYLVGIDNRDRIGGGDVVFLYCRDSDCEESAQTENPSLVYTDSGGSGIINVAWSADGEHLLFQSNGLGWNTGVHTYEPANWYRYDVSSGILRVSPVWPLQPSLSAEQIADFQIKTSDDGQQISFVFASPDGRYIVYAADDSDWELPHTLPLGLADLRNGQHFIFDSVAIAALELFSIPPREEYRITWNSAGTAFVIQTSSRFGSESRVNLITNFDASVQEATSIPVYSDGFMLDEKLVYPDFFYDFSPDGNQLLLRLHGFARDSLVLWDLQNSDHNRLIVEQADIMDAAFLGQDGNAVLVISSDGLIRHHLLSGQTETVDPDLDMTDVWYAWISPSAEHIALQRRYSDYSDWDEMYRYRVPQDG